MFDIEAYATDSVTLYLQCDYTFYKSAQSVLRNAKARGVDTGATMREVVQELEDWINYRTPTDRVGNREQFLELVREVGTRWVNWDTVALDLDALWSVEL